MPNVARLSLLLFLAGAVYAECPSGWIVRGNFCYHFHDISYATGGMTWNNSRLACQRYGGDLVVIKDQNEQNFLANSMTASQKLLHYWIGLSDHAKEGDFVWVDGTSVAATGSHWRSSSGEPNNWGGNEDCAEFHDDGLWNDNWCEREFAFICKKNKDTPIPTALTLPPRPSTVECKRTRDGALYRGTWQRTRSGLICQRWDRQTPHEHTHNLPEHHPSLVNNYCRNPDREPDGPWCYTTDPTKRWEYCDVKFCSNVPIACEAGWHSFNNSCYLFQKESRTWSEGRADCRKRGGDLAIIESQSEHTFLTDRIKRDNMGYWIGLTDQYTEGTFYWVDGKQLNASISFWGRNEPSNAFGGEDCVEMWTWWNTGRWNDNRCAANRNYICEKVTGKSMCPEGWISHADICYQVNGHPEQKKTWLEANEACKSFEGANLLSVHNRSVYENIGAEFRKIFTIRGYFWIGLNDMNKEGSFEWTDGSKYDWKNWGINELRKNTDDLDCVRSELRTISNMWSLADCNSTSEKNYYVCARKREYDRCHSPLGMEDFTIQSNQISASSEKSATTPAASGRRNAVKAFGLDGAWCAATNDQNQWFRIDMGEMYSVKFVGLQGHPSQRSYVKSFYVKYSPDGFRWSTFGYNPPVADYQPLPGNTDSDRVAGATTELSPPIKARFIEIHPLTWSYGICMRVEVYGCPAVADNSECGAGWSSNKALKSCYKIVRTALPWTAARANCLLDHGDLLSITSYDEYNHVKELLRPLRLKTYAFWIGLNSRDLKEVFTWSDGSALTTVQWHSGNPTSLRYNSGSRSCVALRSFYSTWYNTLCANDRPYICKRKLKTSKEPNEKFTGNWMSQTDYYWPLDESFNGSISGTKTGTSYGTVGYVAANGDRQAMAFDGTSSYVKIPGFSQTCVSDPSRCTNGITFSMVLKLDSRLASTSGAKRYLIDIMGQAQNDGAGLNLFVRDGYLGVFLRSSHQMWQGTVAPALDAWFSFAFVWNEQSGLTIYVNGQKRESDNAGTMPSSSAITDRVTDMYIGKSASNGAGTFAKFKMMSLAIWERSLSPSEINDIYLAEMGSCRAGWLPFGQDCFQFNTNQTLYTGAKLDCEKKGGQLAVVLTSVQQTFLAMGIKATGSDSYIGLNSLKRRRFFEWIDGSPVRFSYWYPTRPSSYSWRRYDAVVAKSGSDGRWSDLNYYYSKPYVCQSKKAIVSKSESSSFTGNATVRQYSSMIYGCPLGTKLVILSASFGLPPSCPYIDVLLKVKSLCKNKVRRCSIYASPNEFPNSCSGRKQLKTTYRCDADPDFVATTGCDARWSSEHDNSFCYRLYQTKMNWSNADSFCKSNGAQLVSINSKREEMFLTSMLVNSYELMNIWIGYNDLASRGSYVWSDNTRPAYTNWFNGQPDEGARRGSCVKASMNQGYRGFLSWTDDDCSTQNSFFCKKLKASKTTRTPPKTSVSNSSCLPGWNRYKTNCYQFSAANATWSEASTICQRQRAALAAIHSLDENDAVFDFLVKASLEFAWLGLHDKGVFVGQQWSDGSPVNFVRWDSGQPDSNLGQQACTIMASNGFWRDHDCESKKRYICKATIGTATILPTTQAVTTPVTPTANLKYCPLNWAWSPATGNCYFFSNQTYFASWTDARSLCRGIGGDLVSIESSTELNYLVPFLLTFPSRAAWIGLNDLGTTTGWEWSDGKVTKFLNWQDGQPDNWYDTEDCVIMQTKGKWDDRNCGDKASFICKKANNSVIIASTVAPTAGPLKGFCEPGWLHYRSKCYQLNSDDTLSWMGARNMCRSYTTDGKRGDLASIHSIYENAFLFSQMKGLFDKLYIGFNDIKNEGKFHWSDQSSVDFTSWNSRQPDNYFNSEDCAEIWPFATQKGKWNDVDCSSQLGYICQKDASSKPAPTIAPTTASTAKCPDGYQSYRGNCYSFKKQLMTWDEAAASCRKENTDADLVSIHNTFEAAYVFSHMGEYANRVWIGLHRPSNVTKFRWSDNQPLDFAQWSSYPSYRPVNLRSCTFSFYSRNEFGIWIDSNCTARLPFVCKITKFEPTITPEHPGTCPNEWVKFDKYCYLIRNKYHGVRTWSLARQYCLDKGSDLASIHSYEEQAFLYDIVNKGRHNAWVGLNDRRIENHMVWTDDTPLDYLNWDAKEPNDNNGRENCIEMVYLSGKWNDNRCSSYRGYICKKELGCDQPFGMENGNITDSQITATSVSGNNFPRNARLNGRVAWCAGVFDRNQYIQVDFGESRRLTRVATQGFTSYYVLSFQLYYSEDGFSWTLYKVDGRNPILPGNRFAYSTEGINFKPAIKARFVRINPLTWKHRICLKLEFYGCEYVCDRPLGLESGSIRNFEINASSAEPQNMPHDGRFRKPNGQGWCAKKQDVEQWLQIHVSSNPMKITKVATQGVKVGGNDYVVKAYRLLYSDDGVNWTPYKTFKGDIRIFSGNTYAESGTFHYLTQPFTARYVRFKPLVWSGKICMRVEIYGCPYDCDQPFGIETSKVPDKAIVASSYVEMHLPSFGRLNQGSVNVGSWCAKGIDQHQYLQFDLGAESRVTAVATQGFEADVAMYVTDYWIQFSMDAKFWSLYHSSGVIKTFEGNSNGRTVKKITLPSPIRARYIRINPRHWKQGICMRVELYGCLLQPIVYPTDAPIPKKKFVTGKLRLNKEKYLKQYAKKDSDEFKNMANRIETAITQLYQSNYAFKDGFYGVEVTNLSPGSVVAQFVMIFQSNEGNTTWPLKNAVAKGKVGAFEVDKNSLELSKSTDNGGGSSKKSTQILQREGLSSGGKVALVVVFMILIVLIIAGGVLYYYRRRGKAQFGHTSFDNPVHFTSDVYSSSGERVDNLPSQG